MFGDMVQMFGLVETIEMTFAGGGLVRKQACDEAADHLDKCQMTRGEWRRIQIIPNLPDQVKKVVERKLKGL